MKKSELRKIIREEIRVLQESWESATFKIKKVDGEYQVVVTVNGKRDEARTYYTDDKQDASDTKREMEKEEKKNKDRYYKHAHLTKW